MSKKNCNKRSYESDDDTYIPDDNSYILDDSLYILNDDKLRMNISYALTAL
jgi:hypothetical protein